jgi:anti-anti-sigma factor
VFARQRGHNDHCHRHGHVGLCNSRREIDTVDAAEIRSAVTELIEIGATDLTVDLSRVTRVDVAGLEALVAADRELDAAGGQMVLFGATAPTRRLFEIARLDRAYHIIAPGLGRRSLSRRLRTLR